MNTQRLPLDTDPSEMTDFEKNATTEELEQIVGELDEPDAVVNREREDGVSSPTALPPDRP